MISAFHVRCNGARVDRRTCVILDAAHEVSPIGGQGMTLGGSDAHRPSATALAQSALATTRHH